MATLKHIASKNSDYTAIEAYLVYQHDEFSGKAILDEQGKPKLRESYLLNTLECGDFSFATACLLANRKYNKNNHPDDIKSHQYIISFDPRDAADNGLTMEKAQALGLNFCKENFPGHPAIVCTHPDGHNHSGNIHVHIVFGSVRTREVERKPYFKANNLTKLPSPKKLEAEYAQLASEKAKFYEQYKETKSELLKLKTAKQNVASFFREEEPAQQER